LSKQRGLAEANIAAYIREGSGPKRRRFLMTKKHVDRLIRPVAVAVRLSRTAPTLG